ncbi:MAG: hypothetical protein PHQ60_15860 [Sideroxydans sp.]|nr:hypothetical protein [Sideroxydans sp.]
MKHYLLDSVILIDHFNGLPQATQFLLKQQDIIHLRHHPRRSAYRI